jgi:hypothetical protein
VRDRVWDGMKWKQESRRRRAGSGMGGWESGEGLRGSGISFTRGPIAAAAPAAALAAAAGSQAAEHRAPAKRRVPKAN